MCDLKCPYHEVCSPSHAIPCVLADQHTVAQISRRLERIEVMLQNQPTRQANGWNRAPDHQLYPLVREQPADGPPPAPQLGDLPPDGEFPATRAAAAALTNVQLDALERHYGMAFSGQSAAARSNDFQRFTG